MQIKKIYSTLKSSKESCHNSNFKYMAAYLYNEHKAWW